MARALRRGPHRRRGTMPRTPAFFASTGVLVMNGLCFDGRDSADRENNDLPRITLLGLGNASHATSAANDTHEDSGVHSIPEALRGRWFVRDGGIRM